VVAGVLDIGYYEAGPGDGAPVLLLHGFPYSIDSYVDVAPLLAARGYRVIVPYVRGHGSTRFLKRATPRSGQQGAIGVDVIAFMDALRLSRAVLAGYDWGGRAACVVAALWPERCAGLVSVNSYLIQDIANAAKPLAPSIESGLWYQYYFQTERGRAGLTTNRREIARTLWMRNSPNWHVVSLRSRPFRSQRTCHRRSTALAGDAGDRASETRIEIVGREGRAYPRIFPWLTSSLW
jgi:pimeloyl-ACP methyl ester carboxylesterase